MDPYVAEEHFRQLEELGFVELGLTQSAAGTGHVILRITSAGHDFVENALDDTVWRKAMEKGRDAAWSIFIELLKTAAKGMLQ